MFIWTTDDGRKFIGDGAAFYLLPDGLAMPAAGMLDVFDVALDKRDDWTTADHAADCRGMALFEDVAAAEEEALRGFSPQEMQQVQTMLERIYRNLND